MFSFSEKFEADAFMSAFEGEPFDPRDAGRGSHWMYWYRGKTAKRMKNAARMIFRNDRAKTRLCCNALDSQISKTDRAHKCRPIVTLADVRKYLLTIPEAEHTAAVEAATEAVTMARRSWPTSSFRTSA